MERKLKLVVRTGLLTVVLIGGFASSTFAHYCYNANKPVGAGAITSFDEIKYTKSGKEVLPGAFVNPELFGAGEGMQDIFIHNYLDKAAKNGSPTNGIQEYTFPE